LRIANHTSLNTDGNVATHGHMLNGDAEIINWIAVGLTLPGIAFTINHS
jgi:cystathionine beta-lyase family protein involved in aluminum resistance